MNSNLRNIKCYLNVKSKNTIIIIWRIYFEFQATDWQGGIRNKMSHHLSSIYTQNESSQEDCSLISSSHSPAPSRVNPSHETLNGTPAFSLLLSDFKSCLENVNHRLSFNKKTLSIQSHSWLYEYLWNSQSWMFCFHAALLPKGLLCFPVCMMKPLDDAVFLPELWLVCS